jgi:hypothetical protein
MRMDNGQIVEMIKQIAEQCTVLKNKHTKEKNAPISYVCIFSQSEDEYNELLLAAGEMGGVVDETPTGPLFKINPIETVSGRLKLLKIRIPDKTRPERGDSDFKVSNYPDFKRAYLNKNGFKLVVRPNFEMIELMDPEFNVRVYFPDKPLDEERGIF